MVSGTFAALDLLFADQTRAKHVSKARNKKIDISSFENVVCNIGSEICLLVFVDVGRLVVRIGKCDE